MLCSSISTGKSNSKWLDRLRSSKGFPAGTDLDLDQFLTLQNPHLSNSSDTKVADSTINNIEPQSQTNSPHSRKILDLEQFLTRQNPNLCNSSSVSKQADSTSNNSDPQLQTNSPHSREILDHNIDPQLQTNSPHSREILDRKQANEIPRENGEKEEEWLGIMSNVLAELFYMGDSKDISRIKRKKSFRKQPNPKICVISKSSNDEMALMVPSSDGSSRVEIKGKSERRNLTEQDSGVNVVPVEGGDEEEEKCRADLSGFSRTEVTVIDTSCSSWKFDKMLYRRKNVWKVRDKKGKSMNIGRKKRKLGPLEENVGVEEKAKLSVGQCSSSKEATGEEGKMPLNEGLDQRDKMDEACKETHKMRFPRKLRKDDSSVVLIKNIPASKKKAAMVASKSYVK